MSYLQEYIIRFEIEKHCTFFNNFNIPKDIDFITYGEDSNYTVFFFKNEDELIRFKSFFESKGYNLKSS